MNNSIDANKFSQPNDSVLYQNIKYLKGVGPKRAELYQKLGIDCVYALIHFYPRKYIDCTNPIAIANAELFEATAIKAVVFNKTPGKTIRKNMTIFKLLVSDGASNLSITLFNNKYLFAHLQIGTEYIFYGTLSGNFVIKEMINPIVIPISKANKMKPIYSLTKGLSNNMIESNVKSALDLCAGKIQDIFPENILKEYALIPLEDALNYIHFPQTPEQWESAKKRLVFQELLILTMALTMLKNQKKVQTCTVIIPQNMDEFYSNLPFTLTLDQGKAIDDCLRDMQKAHPMTRLIQGDVGSGKTMVAAACCFALKKNDYQSVIMAPTEILAKQHYKTFQNVFKGLNVNVGFLSGSMAKKEKDAIKLSLLRGEIDILIGTHAVIQRDVVFKNLGLVITDEQHRFGVQQRTILAQKGKNPHVLVMSATPIPRSLALVMYGDLDISLIKTMPAGRKKIETYLIDSGKRMRMFAFIKKQLDSGNQGYIVCPAVEENEESPLDIKNVTEYGKMIAEDSFKNYKSAILHGKMNGSQKDEIMEMFAKKQLDLLVCTTVIEVGVDVASANIIAIENAERFGLSQLHQLRGRVGRGSAQSFCILVSDDKSQETRQRMKALCETNDGFLLAEEDLKSRGPGDFFGNSQHGLPKLKIADLSKDIEIFENASHCAKCIITDELFLLSEQFTGLRDTLMTYIKKINHGSIS